MISILGPVVLEAPANGVCIRLDLDFERGFDTALGHSPLLSSQVSHLGPTGRHTVCHNNDVVRHGFTLQGVVNLAESNKHMVDFGM